MLPSTRNCLGSPLLRKGSIFTFFRALGVTPSRVSSFVCTLSEVGGSSSFELVVDEVTLTLFPCESISLNLVDLPRVSLDLNLVSRVSLELLNLVLVGTAVLNLVPDLSLHARDSRGARRGIAA